MSYIDSVILPGRHKGASIDPVTKFPWFEFVTIPRLKGFALEIPVRADDPEIVG